MELTDLSMLDEAMTAIKDQMIEDLAESVSTSIKKTDSERDLRDFS